MTYIALFGTFFANRWCSLSPIHALVTSKLISAVREFWRIYLRLDNVFNSEDVVLSFLRFPLERENSMTRRFIVVATICATCFVSMGPESEASFRRRGKHGANRRCAPAVATSVSACDTGYVNYAPTAITNDCGCSTGMTSYAPYGQPGVYGTNMNSQFEMGPQMSGNSFHGNVGAFNNQVAPQHVGPQQVGPQ